MPNPGNVIGGHKANLHNPNTSEESKQRSKEILDSEFDGGDTAKYSSAHQEKHYTNPSHVTAGNNSSHYSGSTHSGNLHSGSTHSSTHAHGSSTAHGANPGNVAGGLKATISNPNTSDEAKERAKERLEHDDL